MGRHCLLFNKATNEPGPNRQTASLFLLPRTVRARKTSASKELRGRVAGEDSFDDCPPPLRGARAKVYRALLDPLAIACYAQTARPATCRRWSWPLREPRDHLARHDAHAGRVGGGVAAAIEPLEPVRAGVGVRHDSGVRHLHVHVRKTKERVGR